MQFAVFFHRYGMGGIAKQIEAAGADIHIANGGMSISLGIYLVLFLCGVAYLMTVLAEKNWNLNLGVIFISVTAFYTGIDA